MSDIYAPEDWVAHFEAIMGGREPHVITTEWLAAAATEARKLRAENARLREASIKQIRDVSQPLAQALGGFPWYADDQENFPHATRDDGVCTADLGPQDLAQAAGDEIKRLREAIRAAHEELQDGDEPGCLRILEVAVSPAPPTGEVGTKRCPECGHIPNPPGDCPDCGGRGRVPA